MASQRDGPQVGQTRRPRAAEGEPDLEPQVSTARWVGVIVVLVALGGAIIMAASGIDGGPGGIAGVTPRPPPATHPGTTAGLLPPGVAPIVAAPSPALIAERTWTARVTVPETGLLLRSLDLRVYRNGRQVLSQHLRADTTVTVKDIPLKRGANKISLALANEAGEGPRSEAITVTVDDQAPRLVLREPRSGDVITGATVTVRGRTEAGLVVTVRNPTRDSQTRVTAARDGAFEATVSLAPGHNTLVAAAQDALGNKGTATLDVTRGDGTATGELSLSKNDFRLRDLPATLAVHLVLRDAAARPVDGARVTFSVSASGLPTSTFETTTTDGEAGWSGIRLARDGATAGDGFVTARVTLAGGNVLQMSKPFTFR